MTVRREHFGGANIPTLAATFNSGDPTFQTTAVTGWGTGSGGPFWVRIGKGLPNEEKLLIVSRSGTTFTVAAHGDDGTAPQDHSGGESVEHVGTATELDEANAHIMASVGVHGLAVGVAIAGDTNAQTFRNKTIDGGQNTLQNIPRVASPQIDSKLTALDTKDTSQDTALTTESTNRIAGDAANSAALAAEQTRALAAEGLLAPKASPTLTGTVTVPTPVNSTDAATKGYADLKAPIASPVFTGTVTLPADAASALQAVTKQQLDALIAGRFEWGVANAVAPDANGNVSIAHGAYTPVAMFFTSFSGNTPNWGSAFTVDVRAFGNGSSTVQCHHRSDGSPVGSGAVTFYWLAVKP